MPVSNRSTVALEESRFRRLEQCRDYGFKDKSAAVRIAIEQLRQELERRRLQESARLYA